MTDAEIIDELVAMNSMASRVRLTLDDRVNQTQAEHSMRQYDYANAVSALRHIGDWVESAIQLVRGDK